MREVSASGLDWDTPLLSKDQQLWQDWQQSLYSLKSVSLPRMLPHTSLSLIDNMEIHIFSDASEKAIAAAAYLKSTTSDGQTSVRFIMGKSKLAPIKGHTVPRLELCASVLAIEIAEIIASQLDFGTDRMFFHTDSTVVLGYITNTSRRFYKCVSNRVERILSLISVSVEFCLYQPQPCRFCFQMSDTGG